MKNGRRIDTDLVHAGEAIPRYAGAVSMPVFQSSTFEYAGETEYDDIRYIRLNNTPNHRVLHAKLAALEGGEDALVAASGMAAISAALLAVLSKGDHIIALDCLYGGTRAFIADDLSQFGISHTFVDGEDPAAWSKALTPATKAIYAETITNPLVQVPDLEGLAAFARQNGLIAMIDNTFATPVNFRPLEHGYHLALHSGSKYLNGHTDIVCGAAVGSAALIQRVRHRLNHLGGTLDPHACFLLHRGLKTLALRVRQQNHNAEQIATFLAGHGAVARVNYPGLPGSHHARAARLLDGFGGMVSFELAGGGEAAAQFLERLTIPIKAPSLGGVETLISMPAQTSHLGVPAAERRRMGISDGLIRLSVGIESSADLIEDLQQALAALPARTAVAASA